MTDPIADLLTRIRNAIQARQQVVVLSASKMKLEILRILKEAGLIAQFVVEEKKPQNDVKIFLKYSENKKSVIRKLVRISKPGRRVYMGYSELRLLRGSGVRILSTPKGLLIDRHAKQSKVGGEVLCEVS
ncbi:MAG: 30S ribosomal protein S8 [Deltaproteobacteria bacterium RIFCSPLOWO2_12_FULL_40_28]|nr:MAG: 30S ribosomal protein S8 [Deltaproteobacteria bacterium RIFCSPHIGHO2_02_FULL_40_28]OGQ18995.1 MAG: 30S ribosomal protein S8 [Deltaproteobacteria bacterium RIFCSPHIGHO2_12_FULL_40_32]OGQ39538.1 MAG: 30S ribosomal protein S8 [Deltaproteobacteria bacterium RIFCSPLOWO2_02_FULL_40_36]OGQ53428.1 MAG: 30S ribosomal protein S8 [Deltaproteobacteria bacterium RIFCSPLOWO2_12_FULL_40_28]